MPADHEEPSERRNSLFSFSDFTCTEEALTEEPESTDLPSCHEYITAAVASSKFVVFGRSSGALQVLDLAGNVLRTYPSRHRGNVVSVSLGGHADVVASCGGIADPRVIVSIVFPEGFGRSLAAVRGFGFRVDDGGACAVAVDPEYGRPRWGERVAYGTERGKVVLYTRGWLGGSESTLSKGEGKVEAMAWEGSLLAWACDNGVRVFDTRLDRGVCLIERPDFPLASSPGNGSSASAVEESAVEEDHMVEDHDHRSNSLSETKPPAQPKASDSFLKDAEQAVREPPEAFQQMDKDTGRRSRGYTTTETSAVEISEAPTAEIPEEPAVEIPEEPAAEIPEEPAAEIPEEPAAEISEPPAAGILEAPAKGIQDQSITVKKKVCAADSVELRGCTSTRNNTGLIAEAVNRAEDFKTKPQCSVTCDPLTQKGRSEGVSQIKKKLSFAASGHSAELILRPSPEEKERKPETSGNDGVVSSCVAEHEDLEGFRIDDHKSWLCDRDKKNLPFNCRIQWFYPEGGYSSEYGERTLILIITYPWACKAVEIGPHEISEQRPQRPRSISVSRAFGIESLIDSVGGSFPYYLACVASFPTSIDRDAFIALTVPSKEGERSSLFHFITSQASCSSKVPGRTSEKSLMIKVPGSPPIVLLTSVFSTSSTTDRQDTKVKHSDVIAVRPLSLTERLENFMGRGNYHEALALAIKVPPVSWRSSKLTLAGIGDSYLNSFLDAGLYSKLIEELSQTILQTSPATSLFSNTKPMEERADRWNKWIEKLIEHDKAHLVVEIVPITEPRLSIESYTNLFTKIVKSEPEGLLSLPSLLRRFPLDTIDSAKVMDNIRSAIDEAKSKADDESLRHINALRNCLIAFYEREKDDNGVVDVLLEMRSLQIFDLLFSKPVLYEGILSNDSKLQSLFSISSPIAASQLAHSSPSLSKEDIVTRLEGLQIRKGVFDYLHALFRMDPANIFPFDDQYVELCVEFGSSAAVRAVMRGTHSYNVERALEVMADRTDLVGERVYLMKAVGDFDGALEILMKEGGGVKQAVDFIEGEGGGDEALWTKLYEYAEKNTDALGELLERAGAGGVDSTRLVKVLNSDKEIEGLREKLLRAVLDARLERELREACNAALEADAYVLIEQLERGMMEPL